MIHTAMHNKRRKAPTVRAIVNINKARTTAEMADEVVLEAEVEVEVKMEMEMEAWPVWRSDDWAMSPLLPA